MSTDVQDEVEPHWGGGMRVFRTVSGGSVRNVLGLILNPKPYFSSCLGSFTKLPRNAGSLGGLKFNCRGVVCNLNFSMQDLRLARTPRL
jgi:hypothetical protein